MNYSLAVFLINDQARAVVGVYEDPKEVPNVKRSTFKTLDPTIKVDDICVVPSTTRHGMTTVKIVEVDIPVNYESTDNVPWIVQRVDKAAFEKLVKAEQEAIDRIHQAESRRKREELRKAILADDAANITLLPASSEPAQQ